MLAIMFGAAPASAAVEQLKQMRQDDEAVYQSLRSICRGC